MRRRGRQHLDPPQRKDRRRGATPLASRSNERATGPAPVVYRLGKILRRRTRAAGFTLLEVLVALTILGVGAALTLSLISGALGNIRKVQLRIRNMHHAETVLELTLLDDSIRGPRTLTGDFQDGTRWAVVVNDFDMPREQLPLPAPQQALPVKMLSYTVEIFAPESPAPDFRLQTLKLVGIQPEERGLPAIAR